MLGCLLALLMLPSCLTRSLWNLDTETITRSRLVGSHADRSEGNLDHTDEAVVWRGLDGGEVWARPLGNAADVLLAVLSQPQFCEVLEAAIHRSRVIADTEVLEESVRLDVIVRMQSAAVAEIITELDLTPATQALVRAGASVDERVPLSFRQCAFRLSTMDLNWLTGRAGAWTVAAMVFVDADGEPLFKGTVGVADEAPLRTLQERMSELGKASLVARLDGDKPVLLRLRPDRLWLSGLLPKTGDRAVLQTPIELLTGATGNPAIGTRAIPATYVQSVTRYERVTIEKEGMSVWSKLALTPFTLALDLVFGGTWAAIFAEDDDEGDEEYGSGTRRSLDAGPRRPGETEQAWRARVQAWETSRRR